MTNLDERFAMTALLDACAEAFHSSRERFSTQFAPLEAEVAMRRPAPDSWSVAECIQHLCVSLDLYGERLEPLLEEADSRGSAPDYGRGTLAGRLLLWAMNPGRKKRLRLKVPGRFRPMDRQGLEWEPLLDRYPARCERWLRNVERARGLPLGRLILPSPVSKWLRLSAAQALQVNAWHQGRHLDQAARALHAVQALSQTSSQTPRA